MHKILHKTNQTNSTSTCLTFLEITKFELHRSPAHKCTKKLHTMYKCTSNIAQNEHQPAQWTQTKHPLGTKHINLHCTLSAQCTSAQGAVQSAHQLNMRIFKNFRTCIQKYTSLSIYCTYWWTAGQYIRHTHCLLQVRTEIKCYVCKITRQ